MKERGNSNEKEKEKRGFGSFSLPAHVADMANVLGVNVSANEKGVGLAKREREEDVHKSLIEWNRPDSEDSKSKRPLVKSLLKNII